MNQHDAIRTLSADAAAAPIEAQVCLVERLLVAWDRKAHAAAPDGSAAEVRAFDYQRALAHEALALSTWAVTRGQLAQIEGFMQAYRDWRDHDPLDARSTRLGFEIESLIAMLAGKNIAIEAAIARNFPPEEPAPAPQEERAGAGVEQDAIDWCDTKASEQEQAAGEAEPAFSIFHVVGGPREQEALDDVMRETGTPPQSLSRSAKAILANLHGFAKSLADLGSRLARVEQDMRIRFHPEER